MFHTQVTVSEIIVCFRGEVSLTSIQPWTDVYLPERVDKALAEVCKHSAAYCSENLRNSCQK